MPTTPAARRFDAAAALRTLAQIRESIPEKFRVQVTPPAEQQPQSFLPAMALPAGALSGAPSGALPAGAINEEDALEDFELQALQDGVESVLAELTASLDHARELALAQALNVYYTAEELAREPEHAALIPHVEAMRAAYIRDFGKPIPPRKKD